MIAIQTGPVAEELNTWAEGQSYDRRTIYPERGKIYDRWGHMLAGNKIVYELGLELREPRNAQSIALTLSSIMPDLKYEEVLAAAAIPYDPTNAAYYTLASFVEEDVIQKIKLLKAEYENVNPGGENPNLPSLNGIAWYPRLIRYYPEGKLAGNVLGIYTYANVGGETGAFGVEGYYNNLLAGRPEQMVLPFDPYEMQALPEIPPGADLILTIDREMQAAVESILDRAMEKNGSRSGTIIVYQPETGEILAMASSPRMDPNRYNTTDWTELFPEGVLFNNAVSFPYEPGSVFKVLTMAAAIDAGVVTPDTTFVDNGAYAVGEYTIYNWNLGAWGEQTMTGCMQHSLNVCLSWLAVEKLGKVKFYEYMEAFGIGHRTNVDLAMEGEYPFSTPVDGQDWPTSNLATNSFGQGVAVTPIQMVQTIGAVANDGKMMWPHVVKGYVQDGRQYNIDPLVVGTPISAETARTVTEMLTITLEEESFSNASVPGYSVAGKTGTAQIAEDGRYLENFTNTSFVGWGPSEDPKFLVYIWFERPKSDTWGSTVAAPVFPPIFKELVRIGNIPPDDIRLQLTGK